MGNLQPEGKSTANSAWENKKGSIIFLMIAIIRNGLRFKSEIFVPFVISFVKLFSLTAREKE